MTEQIIRVHGTSELCRQCRDGRTVEYTYGSNLMCAWCASVLYEVLLAHEGDMIDRKFDELYGYGGRGGGKTMAFAFDAFTLTMKGLP